MCHFKLLGSSLKCSGSGFLGEGLAVTGMDSGFSIPCPSCNTLTYLERVKVEAESNISGHHDGRLYTGETLWLSAVRLAESVNLDMTRAALAAIGIVTPLAPDPDSVDGFKQMSYVYSQS